ncbi:hypothetical protein B0H15DRAFT_340848 [Mycena belliarum]|uniref:F-box domain-containing protein n=1 Tax=Mycena belliarum TaxID=1033014 RepID=A0AAD6U1S3_9AGAR|nr:hypothetical protein B0H15DRAFT_340848 [Mycena belliae]
MHEALRIPELVDLICRHCFDAPDWDWDSDKIEYGVKQPRLCALAVAARTCKTFHDPALNLLWSSASLFNLLCCLPADSRRIYDSEVPRMELLRPLTPTDWERVLVYASRVKHLFAHPNHANLAKILPLLASSVPPKMLFNLRGIHWQHNGADFPAIGLFLEPSLTVLSIPASSSASALSLTATLPRLTDVSLVTDPKYLRLTSYIFDTDYTVQEVQDISNLLRRLPATLETLSTPILDQASFAHLACSPRLRNLTIHRLRNDLSNSRAGAGAFPALEKLDMTADLRAVTRFFGQGAGADMPLATLSLMFPTPTPATAEETHGLYSALAASVAPTRLRSLILLTEGTLFDISTAPHVLIRAHSLRRLLPFANLKSVYICSPVGIDLDDALLEELAASWRGLESLELDARYPPPAPPRATIACLASFAAHCPRLECLSLTFDARAPPPVPAGVAPHAALTSLQVEHSPASAPTAVWQFLAHLFPALEDLDHYVQYDDHDSEVVSAPDVSRHECWNEVQSLLLHSRGSPRE